MTNSWQKRSILSRQCTYLQRATVRSAQFFSLVSLLLEQELISSMISSGKSTLVVENRRSPPTRRLRQFFRRCQDRFRSTSGSPGGVFTTNIRESWLQCWHSFNYRQQPRHTMESILQHLSTCLQYDMSPRYIFSCISYSIFTLDLGSCKPQAHFN